MNMLLRVVYRSDNNTKDMNDCLNKVLREADDERKEVMVIGDFNFREINWETMTAGSQKSDDFLDHVDVVMDNLWTQHVTKPTRLDSLLDLRSSPLTPAWLMKLGQRASWHKLACDHSVVQWEMNYQVELERPTPKRDFKNANYDKMKDELKTVNWNEELEACTTEEGRYSKRNFTTRSRQMYQCSAT